MIDKICNIIIGQTTPVLFNGKFTLSFGPTQTVDRVLFGQKIANIVLAGPDLRLIFKIHYTNDLGEKVLSLSGRNDYKEREIDDYFLESCNHAAGRIKNGFSEQSTLLGISIPVKTKSFDDLFFNIQADGQFFQELHWELNDGEIKVHFSLFIEILNLDFKIDPAIEHVKQVEELEFF